MFKQFEIQFDPVQASFGVNKPKKMIEEWFKEVEDCDFIPFVKTMKRIKYGDKFPTFAVFWAEYRNADGVKHGKDLRGCKHCRNGVVTCLDYHPKAERVTELASNCALCSPGKSSDMKDINPHYLVKDNSDQLITKEALGLLSNENGA